MSIEAKPFMKHLTSEERKDIMTRAMEALDRDDNEEYDRLCMMLPVDPEMANDLKRSIGIEELVASGMNLIKAVEKYGEAWLRN
jgi:hypothetical protein